MSPRPDRPSLATAWWASRALWTVRRDLRRGPVRSARIPPPPPAALRTGRGLFAVLRFGRASCLERSLVLQRWLAARGQPRAVVIGVASPAAGFRAHAWLEGEPSRGFHEVSRVEP